MYIVALDRPWSEVHGLGNRQRIERPEDIALLKQCGVRHVTIDPSQPSHGPDGTPRGLLAAMSGQPPAPPQLKDFLAVGALEQELSRARTIRMEALTIVQGIFEGVKTGQPLNSAEVKEAVHGLISQILRGHSALLCVTHIRQYDTNLFTHAVDACVFALVVGKQQGFDKSRLEHLGTGALLHDIGYLRLPRNLFRKQGVFTAQERRLMQQHPRLGALLLSEAQDMSEDVQRILLEHHERRDGSGYPGGLQGLSISPLSEIVSIVDVYDAMLSSREGRPPLPPAQAIKELYKLGLQGQFDRGWCERIIQCFGIYPVGSLVEFNTGERGVVTAVHPEDTLRPCVKLVWDATRQPYATPFIVDLASPNTPAHERQILRALDPHQEHIDIEVHLDQGAQTPVAARVPEQS
jgi:HD-GYP domain-containing protein (c-di-GMP phosphodiesterase class II)